MERERKRLEEVAQERGFESAAIMFHTMYITQEIPITKIAQTLYTPMWTLRKRFDELGIPVRPRGGQNNVKIVITTELAREIARDGVRAVALRLGVDSLVLALRIRDWYHNGGQL